MKVRETDGAHRQYSAESHAAREAAKIYSQGYFAETLQRGAWSTSAAQSTQQIIGSVLGLAKGDVVTGLALEETIIGSGVTLAKVALVSLSGVVLAVSADFSTAVNAAIGEKLVNLLASYTATEDMGVFSCHLQVGTTPAAFTRGAGAAGAGGGAAINGQAAMGFTLSAQADFPAVGGSLSVATVSSLKHWMGAY